MKSIRNNTTRTYAKWMLATILLAISVTIRAQTEAKDTTAFQYQVGDTVIIRKDCLRYLTGERMSTWVYYVAHPIQQVGTKRFPNGVLLGGILSWVDPHGLVLQGAVERNDSTARAAAKQQKMEAAQEVNQRAQETEELNELQKALIEQQAAAHGSETIKADTTLQSETQETPETSKQEWQPAPMPVDTVSAESELSGASYTVNTQPDERNYHRVSVGLRGGAASLMHKTEKGKWNCGFNALLDVQYAYFWTKFGRLYDLGITTGLSIGYTQSGMRLNVNDQYTVNTSDGVIDYTLSADRIKENDGQIQLEIPVMFSMVMHNGFFLNVGPRFLLPVYTPYQQTITNPNVDAYFQEEGVHVSNEVITGMLTDDQLKSKGTNANQFKINITLSAELGYEWKLKNKHAIGLGAYANYGLWNAFKNNTDNTSLISITPPSTSGNATVDILSATNTYASKLGYFDAGVKLVYHFKVLD